MHVPHFPTSSSFLDSRPEMHGFTLFFSTPSFFLPLKRILISCMRNFLYSQTTYWLIVLGLIEILNDHGCIFLLHSCFCCFVPPSQLLISFCLKKRKNFKCKFSFWNFFLFSCQWILLPSCNYISLFKHVAIKMSLCETSSQFDYVCWNRCPLLSFYPFTAWLF